MNEEDHSYGATLYKGGRHNPASVAWACIWQQEIAYRKGEHDADIGGHEFWSRPAYILKNGNEMIITGELWHINNGAPWWAVFGLGLPIWSKLNPDDRITYEIRKVDSKITSIDTKIQNRGFAVYAAPMMTVVNVIMGTAINPDDAAKLAAELQGLIKSQSWEVAANAIVINIAMLAT